MTTPQVPTYVPSIPPDGGRVMAGWDPSDNRFHPLNLDILRQLQVLMEAAHILGILDGRDQVSATIASGSAVGATASAEIEVPTDEVWFIHLILVTSPAESGVGVGDIVQVNFRISVWPDEASEHGQAYWQNNQGTAALDSYYAEFHPGAPFIAMKDLPVPLRLPGGSKIRLEATLIGAAAGASLSATLTPYGYKGKQLIT